MNLVTIVLNKTECLGALLNAFVKNDIKGATILDSIGMARAINEEADLKFVASLKLILNPEQEGSKTIFLIAEDDKISKISNIVNVVTGGLDRPDTGIMFCVPVSYVEGINLG
ncbi:MAG: hypothetical protein E7391_03170 [Ruminococcaceae bacterium]|nr:hypothetical protein [Oscillospiraceae bacterium]